VPFLLSRPGFATRELEKHVEAGEAWRVLEATYPDDVPAQKRLDYTTDVLGGVATHYCYDPMTFDGIIISTLRRVVRRTSDGPLLSGRTSFILDYVDVTVRR
jgi:hypothetical protein